MRFIYNLFLVVFIFVIFRQDSLAQTFNSWRQQTSSNCAASNGLYADLCKDTSLNELFYCSSIAGSCNASGWIAVGSSYSFPDSVVNNSGTITLQNDTASPGNVYCYSTNNSGVKGWYLCPSASGSGTVTSVTLATPNSTLSLGGTNPITTSGTINADINLTNPNIWTGQQIFNTANVGINSVNPGQWLDVKGTIRATAFMTPTGTSSQFLKANGTVDSNTYITGNQTITLSGDTTGSGTTAITTTLKNTGTAGTYRSTTFDAQGRETSGTNPTTFSGYAISDTSANLAAALTDESGTGVAIFGTAPTFTTSINLGTANIITDTSTGTKIATATNQKLGFFNSTPIVQPSGDLLTAFNTSNLGLVASPSLAQADITGLTTGSSPTFAGLTLSGLTASLPVFTSSGSALTTGTLSGNTTKLATSTGTLTNGDCVKLDSNGNYIDSGSACGSGSSQWTTTNTNDVYLPNNGNVGIGTTMTKGAALTVMNGNVGIGTWAPGYPLQIGNTINSCTGNACFAANVGIGLTTPGQALDVTGTVRASALVTNGGTSSQFVKGDGTLDSNTYLTSQVYPGAGIANSTGSAWGTSYTTTGSGTVVALATSPSIATPTVTTSLTISAANIVTDTTTGTKIGTGTNQKLGFYNSTPIAQPSGDLLTAIATSNLGLVASPTLSTSDITGLVNSQWITTNTNDIYLPNSGNVGIGTTLTTTSALAVMNGNVGIGTWKPIQLLDVAGSGYFHGGSGPTYITNVNVGIGTVNPTGALEIEGGNVGIGLANAGQLLDVNGTIRATQMIDTGVTASKYVYQNSSQQLSAATLGTGLADSSGTLSSNAVNTVSYQPGLLSAINGTIGVNYKFSKASTVDNLVGSAVTFSCVSNPTITMYECGVSATCTSPTTIGTVTVTTAGTAVTGTVSNPAITAGDYIGWAMTAGTCASIDIAATAQTHSN